MPYDRYITRDEARARARLIANCKAHNRLVEQGKAVMRVVFVGVPGLDPDLDQAAAIEKQREQERKQARAARFRMLRERAAANGDQPKKRRKKRRNQS
jgi:hypothetical protein